MKIFTCTDFGGHYPVGAAALIVASSQDHALNLLEKALEDQGLHLNGDENIEKGPTGKPFCEILVNGDY